MQLHPPAPKAEVSHRPPRRVRTSPPKLVVKGERVQPRVSNPYEWTLVGTGRKV